MYYKNFKYLLSKTGKTQRVVLNELGYDSEAVVHEWSNGKKPRPGKLKRISSYFSRELKIPIERFRDGNAFLEDDFSAWLLPVNDPSTAHQSRPTPDLMAGNQPTAQEFINFIAHIENGTDKIPPSPRTLARIMQLIQLTGLGWKWDQLIEFMRALKEDNRGEKMP